jgi:transcriptional regulator with XRE-family HTH domain
MPAQKLIFADRAERYWKSRIAELGTTQEKIAKAVGRNQGSICKWIGDIDRITVGDLRKMCKYLRVKPSDFFLKNGE